MTLAELQRAFQQHVHTGAPVMRDLVREVGTASPARRLAVYAEGYRLRLLEVLTKDFPGLRELAGESRCENLCRGYIECFPSASFNARWYGAHLAEYLKTADASAHEPALAEMAALEWALTLAFDAPDLAPLLLTEIAAVPPQDWSRMIFTFHPALVLVAVLLITTPFNNNSTVQPETSGSPMSSTRLRRCRRGICRGRGTR